MKKNMLLLVMPFLLFTAVHAADRAHCYAKLLSGVNFLQNAKTDGNQSSFEPGYIIDGSLGYRWATGVRLEGEYAYRRNALNRIDFLIGGFARSGSFQTSSFMANLLWDLPLCSCQGALRNIQPFIGIGLGYDFQQMHSSNSFVIFKQKWNSLAWQTMAGFIYQTSCTTAMTLEYKFHLGGRHFYNHTIGIGLVYKFGCSD